MRQLCRVCILLVLPVVIGAQAGAADMASGIRVLRWQGAINPVAEAFIVRQILKANEQSRALLILLDTPGGLDSSMRGIIQAELASQSPIIVHVHPSGARAASAGALIALAADFVVMAPGTNIGAAHPVAIGPGPAPEGRQSDVMTTKVVNDAVAYARSIAEQRGRDREWAEKIVRESLSTPASRAHEIGIADLVENDWRRALERLDGRVYRRNGEERVFHGRGLQVVRVDMNTREKILNVLSNPNVAYLLLMLGFLGIFFEISQPGVILPGAIGSIALLLAFFGLQTLPVSGVGVLLILLGLVLFLLEIKVPSYGMLSVGGIVSLGLGSLMLIDSADPAVRVDPVVVVATVALFSGLILLVVRSVLRAQKGRVVSGVEGMVGERGVVRGDLTAGGRVFIHGEYWDAEADEPVEDGSPVEVVQVLPGFRLRVRPVRSTEQSEERS
ncbi:MAG: nodulation protein NfeD [Gammaproteobacteria bacterium]|nr:MAG: nodulation protein NfeD [Gammaproteobacteria bacterium]